VRPRSLSVVALVTLVVVAVAGVALSLTPRRTPPLPSALASMPAETLTASVTDWARVRATLGATGDLGAGAGLLGRAYDTDLSAVSVLGDMADVMEPRYGWSVHDALWEGLAQSRQGAALVVQMPAGFDLQRVRERLRALEYLPPFESDGVWRGGKNVVARIDGSLTPLLGHAVVLDEQHRLVFSDTKSYARRTAAVIQGSVASLGQQEPVTAVAEQLGGATASVVHTGRRGCQVMGFGSAAAPDKARARQRVAAVGGLRPYAAVGLGLMAGAAGEGGGPRRAPMLVAMHFADAGAADDQVDRRSRLAVGDAPAQGGTYESRFSVASAMQRGGDVVLRLRPREADSQLLSDLGSGALLFASCG
jgi:hypothetical protein